MSQLPVSFSEPAWRFSGAPSKAKAPPRDPKAPSWHGSYRLERTKGPKQRGKTVSRQERNQQAALQRHSRPAKKNTPFSTACSTACAQESHVLCKHLIDVDRGETGWRQDKQGRCGWTKTRDATATDQISSSSKVGESSSIMYA